MALFTADQLVAHAVGDYTEKDVTLFWAKVRIGAREECWPWLGNAIAGGYGLFDRRKEGKRRLMRAHRFAYQSTRGPIPPGLLLRHSCDNPPCCNPWHLVPGTPADNSADMVERQRHWTQRRPHSIPRGDQHWTARLGTAPLPRGEAHARAKLTEAAVRAIRCAQGKSQRQLAREFGVSQALIWQVRSGNYWQHVSAEATHVHG